MRKGQVGGQPHPRKRRNNMKTISEDYYSQQQGYVIEGHICRTRTEAFRYCIRSLYMSYTETASFLVRLYHEYENKRNLNMEVS